MSLGLRIYISNYSDISYTMLACKLDRIEVVEQENLDMNILAIH